MNKTIRILNLLMLLLCNTKSFASIITTLNNVDPVPMFSSSFPYDYLYVNEKEFMKGRTNYIDPLRFSFAASPFYQRSDHGKDLHGSQSELGDIGGKWNMLAFLPGGNAHTTIQPDLPHGKKFPASLLNSRDNLLGCIKEMFNLPGEGGGTPLPSPMPSQLNTIEGLISLQDTPRRATEELFGFFSVPIKYRKRGARFEAVGKLFCDFGFAAQTGVVNISQVATFVDQINCPVLPDCTDSCATAQAGITCANPFATNPDSGEIIPTINTWYQILNCLSRDVMNRLQQLAKDTKNDLCNYQRTSMEDVHIEGFWRHAYRIETPNLNDCLTCGLFIPFVSAGASFPTGEKQDPNKIFSVPAGNNGHYAVRFDVGATFDFDDTIEFGAHGGLAHFFKRKFDEYRVPNNMYQSGIYPFTTGVEVNPGNTWHIGLMMNAYHFIDCLSFYGEYLYVTHDRDKIKLLQPDGVFQPGVLECKSPWNVQLFNFGFNYDVSRNFRIGCLLQIPVDRKHAYKTSTYMVSTEIVF